MDRAVDALNRATPGADLSLWGLFLEADIVVKIVMLGLLAASVWVARSRVAKCFGTLGGPRSGEPKPAGRLP